MVNLAIESIHPNEFHDGSFIEAEIIWISDVKTSRPGNFHFRFFQRILLADKTGNILGLIKTINKDPLTDLKLEDKVGKYFRIPLPPGSIAPYNKRFSVGEHVNGAELWLSVEDIATWEELETVDNAAEISSTIPFHFLDFNQVRELAPEMPYDVLGTVIRSYGLEDYRPPTTEIQLRICGGIITLAGWDTYSDILGQTNQNGEPIKVAIKGVRKLGTNPDTSSHVGNTADIFVIRGDEDLQIFDEQNMDIYRATFQ